MSLGRQLKLLRKGKNMQQKELAVLLKVSTATVSNYENDVHFPDEASLHKLSDIFGVSVDYLMERTQLRYSLDILNSEIEEDYPLSLLVNKIVNLDVQYQSEIRHYVEYLELISQKKPVSDK